MTDGTFTHAAEAAAGDTDTGDNVPGRDFGWRIVRSGHDPDRLAHDGTIFALANGSLGVRGGCEETGGSGGCFLAAAFQRAPIHYHERFPGFAALTDTRIPVADGSEILIRADGRQLSPADRECALFRHELDLRRGISRRVVQWEFAGRGALELTVERVVPVECRGLLAIRMHLRSRDFAGEIVFDSVIRGDHAAPGQGDDPRIGVGSGGGMQWLRSETGDRLVWVLQATPDDRLQVACGQTHRFGDDALTAEVAERGDFRVTSRLSGRIGPGQSLCLDKFVAWAWTPDPAGQPADNPGALRDALQRELDRATEAGFDALCQRQASRLETFWQKAAVAIDGDPEAERALRFNLFHLFQSASRDGASGTAAKGLTGDGYEGHCFWDSEAFMLPVLAMTTPDLARAALEFRHRTLPAARRHAREMNHERGALYPWRTIAGDECSGYYPSGSAQYHINAAIAWAIRVYIDATGDTGFLLRCGAEILFETARLWLDAGHFDPRREGAFCICGVTGPDEYSALVDNNFYTNRMARAHLLDAVAVWQRIRQDDPGAARELAERLALEDDEVEQWQEAAKAMYLPFDEALGVYAQNDGFLDKPVWDFANTPAANYPLLLHYHPLTLYRHQVCKQADVVQALIMDGGDIDRETKRRCFNYYSGVTTHDSTLSAGSFAILAAELDRPEATLAGFDDTLYVDLENLHGNTDHGAHMAAMAASWQCLAFGIAGLRLSGERLHLAPKLPARWRGWRLPLAWRGRRLRIDVDRDGAHYTLIDGAALTLVHHAEEVAVSPGCTESRQHPKTAAWPLLFTDRPIEAMIFDLDGVLTDTAELHYRAWQRLADELGIEFDRRTNRRLKGVDRMTSLHILLENAGYEASQEERAALAERKNGYYRESIRTITPKDLLPGAREALKSARAAGTKLALASASRNAPALLERLDITGYFDFIADPAEVGPGKPDPAIFLAAGRGLDIEPAACIGIEDAAAGITAIKAAGMAALGIGRRRDLPGADAVLDGLHQFRIETIPLAGSYGSESAHSANRNR